MCVTTSPYRIRLRFERGTVRRYASFSLPLVGAGLSRLLVVQGALIVANHVGGLAGVGAIGLATTYAVFADRVDAIVSQTIYPAVCAVDASSRERSVTHLFGAHWSVGGTTVRANRPAGECRFTRSPTPRRRAS